MSYKYNIFLRFVHLYLIFLNKKYRELTACFMSDIVQYYYYKLSLRCCCICQVFLNVFHIIDMRNKKVARLFLILIYC